jgi:hypothetical protein
MQQADEENRISRLKNSTNLKNIQILEEFEDIGSIFRLFLFEVLKYI